MPEDSIAAERETASGTPWVLEADHIAKSFGPVVALSDVSLRLAKGEVLGLVGDNGAGKSTLIKILTGFHAPDRGEIRIRGKRVHFTSPADARAAGIETVYQDLGLVGELSVARNMFLGREPLRRILGVPFLDDRKMREEAAAFLERIRVNVPSVDTPVALLSGGQRQAVAVARSLYLQPDILILDEPLAAMGAKEGRMILDLVVEQKRRRETAVILIAHNYAQIFEVCDRINWLAQGRVQLDKPVHETSIEELTELVMAGYRSATTA